MGHTKKKFKEWRARKKELKTNLKGLSKGC
jgi:hypothetical protein